MLTAMKPCEGLLKGLKAMVEIKHHLNNLEA